MTRKEIALRELKALSREVARFWYAHGEGQAPTLEALGSITDLARLYKDARTLYDAGDYLGCIAVLTKDEEIL